MNIKNAVFACACLCCVAFAHAEPKQTMAVLMSDSPLYRNAARDDTRPVELKNGEPVYVLSSGSEKAVTDGIPCLWYRVKTFAGKIGWLPGSRLALSDRTFSQSFFSTLEQYERYIRMAARRGEQVVAVRSYEKVRKGDIGYIVSIDKESDSLAICVVWEHNLAATPVERFLPSDFPKALIPYVYFVNWAVVELTGSQETANLAALARTLPADFPEADEFSAEHPDVELPWYISPENFDYSLETGDSPYDYYDEDEDSEQSYEPDDETSAVMYTEGAETSGFIKVGSVVILGKHEELGGASGWEKGMDAFVGKEATVREVLGPDAAGFLTARVEGNPHTWRIRNMALKGRGEAGSYGYKIGDAVILGAHRYIDGDNNWAPDMEQYVGKRAVIKKIEGKDESGSCIVTVDIDNGHWSWRVETMSPADKK